MIPAWIIAWVTGRAVQLGIVALGLSVAVGSCVMRDKKIEAKGAAKQAERTKEANNAATRLGSGAARKSRTNGVRGPIDPSYRND